MTTLHAIVLGIVQGATEFLPVSSSGHLILVPALLGWPDQGLAFDASVHLGTALALFCYFAGELRRLGRGILAGNAADRQLLLALVAGTIPAGLVGFLFEHAVERHLRSTTVVAVSMIVWACVLWCADRFAERAHVHDLHAVGVRRGLVVGLAQVLALVPGTSRSGVTLSASLFTGLDRSTAARFAFLLGLPLTAAAGLLKTVALARGGVDPGQLSAVLIGTTASFVAGLAAISLLVAYLRRSTLGIFVVYRLALGVLLLVLTRH